MNGNEDRRVPIHQPRYEAPLKRTKPAGANCYGQGMGRLHSTETAIYTAPTATGATITNISLVNTFASATTYSIGFRRSGDTTTYYIATQDTSLAPKAGNSYDYVVTLQPGDSLRGIASTTNVIDYLVSGVEEKQSPGSA